MFEVKIIDIMVHQWDNEHGQGDHVCNKGGFVVGRFATVDDAKQGLLDYFDVKEEDVDFDNEYASFSLIEDIDAYATPDGKFIADYTVLLSEITPAKFPINS